MKIITTLVLFLVCVSPVLAHSGRTDSSGGHNCNVGACAGTYHYHNGGGYVAPVYYPPAPRCTPPSEAIKNGSWTFSENGCNQDVTITWDKGSEKLFYSIAISKTPGANPGPSSDTSAESFSFKNVTPGKWYINMKSGNSCSWSNIKYWTVEVPAVKPKINSFSVKSVNEKKAELYYDVSCANSATISNVGAVSLNKLSITIFPKIDTTYKLIANGRGGSVQKEVTYIVPTPTPTIILTPVVSSVEETSYNETKETQNEFWSWLLGLFGVK